MNIGATDRKQGREGRGGNAIKVTQAFWYSCGEVTCSFPPAPQSVAGGASEKAPYYVGMRAGNLKILKWCNSINPSNSAQSHFELIPK